MSLEEYTRRVALVKTAGELADALETCVRRPHEPWSLESADPLYAEDLAHALWELRPRLQAARSFLHVGTHYGFVYFAIREFLRAVNPGICCSTTDVRNYCVDNALVHIAGERHVTPTERYYGSTHDVVALDGCKDLCTFMMEYNHIGARAGVCIILHARGAWWWNAFKRSHAVHERGGVAWILR